MKDVLSVFIPTLNEEANLPRCLEKLSKLGVTIYIVDSNSTDRTVEIAIAAGCQVFTGSWRTFSDKLNWAIDELPILTPWMMRLDADEWITDELVVELRTKLVATPPEIAAYAFKRRVYFLNRWIRYGGYYPSWKINLWRTHKARCEVREIDEQMQIDGKIAHLQHDIVDENMNSLAIWTAKHNWYSDQEVVEFHRAKDNDSELLLPKEMSRNRWLRENIFYKMPLFVRPLGYWIYRYIFRLGFLDGTPGLIFHTLHAFWYRFLVDAKIYEKRIREK